MIAPVTQPLASQPIRTTPAGNQDLRTVARGGSIATVGALVAAAGGLLLTVVVGRGLGAEGAGLFFEAIAVFMIASSVAMLGSDTSLLRHLSRAQALGRYRDIRPTLWIALVPVVLLTCAATAVLLLLVPAIVRTVLHSTSATDAQTYLYLLLPFLLIGALSVVLAQATRAFGGVIPFVAVQNVLLPIGRPLAILVIVIAGWSVLVIPVAWAGLFIPALLIAGSTLARQVRRTEERITADTPPARSTRELATEFWRFSSVRGLAAAIDLSLVWFDVLLVGAIRSTQEAGTYATASRFITSGTLVMQAMRLAIAPQISALMSTGRPDRASEIYRVATLWIIVTSWPLYLALALFGPIALRIFGDDFGGAGTALTILALFMLINLGSGNVGTMLLMAGRSSWLLANKAAAITVNVALNLILVPDHGINGAAIAWGVAIAVDNLAAVALVRWRLGLRGYGWPTGLAAALSLVVFGAGGLLTRALLGHGTRALVVYLVAGTLVYAALVWHWRNRFHMQEIRSAFAGRRARSDTGASAEPADGRPLPATTLVTAAPTTIRTARVARPAARHRRGT